MTLDETVAELRSLAWEPSAKTYITHGTTGEVLGVKYADLYKLQKRIKKDQALANQLWATDISDARTLALLIADPRSGEGCGASRAEEGLTRARGRRLHRTGAKR